MYRKLDMIVTLHAPVIDSPASNHGCGPPLVLTGSTVPLCVM
jgi:hypothetical protein